MIGKKIKSLIDASGLKYADVSKKLDISYQNLNRILNKESVETRYLFSIANILNIPVTTFFEDEPGGTAPTVDVEKLKEENVKLINRIIELEEQLIDKKLIIKMLGDKDFREKLSDNNFNENIKKLGLYDHNLLNEELSSTDKELTLIASENVDVKELINKFLPYFSEQLLNFLNENKKNNQK